MLKKMLKKAPRKKSRAAKRAPSAPPPTAHPNVSAPADLFELPFFKAVLKTMRPPTALTRRKQITIRMQFPRESFERLMGQVKETGCLGLKRGLDGRLLPTKVSTVLSRFKYSISKPSAHDRLFRFGELDMRLPAGGRRLVSFKLCLFHVNDTPPQPTLLSSTTPSYFPPPHLRRTQSSERRAPNGSSRRLPMAAAAWPLAPAQGPAWMVPPC